MWSKDTWLLTLMAARAAIPVARDMVLSSRMKLVVLSPSSGGPLGHQTNNYAEYSALLAALNYTLRHGFKALKVISDSELLVKQISGEYKVSSPTLKELHGRAVKMLDQLDYFDIKHVLRERNREADRLANVAMGSGIARKAPAVPATDVVECGFGRTRNRWQCATELSSSWGVLCRRGHGSRFVRPTRHRSDSYAVLAQRLTYGAIYLYAFSCARGPEGAVAGALHEVVVPTRAEAGCLSINAFRSIRDPRLFYIHSRWTNEAAFDLHAELPIRCGSSGELSR